MKTVRKVDGEVFEDENGVDEKEVIERVKVFSNLINYDCVNKNKYRLSSTTVNSLVNAISEDDNKVLYSAIVKCTTREELEKILYRMFNIAIDTMRFSKSYSFLADNNFKTVMANKRKAIEESIDTSLATMVYKVIWNYYRDIIKNLRESEDDRYKEIKKIYMHEPTALDDIFEELKMVDNKEVKACIISAIKDVVRNRFNKKDGAHLCFDCPIGYSDTCPKISDMWPKHLEDYDFITEGVEVDYEHASEMGDDLESGNTVKELIVSECKLREDAVKKNYKRLGVYGNK